MKARNTFTNKHYRSSQEGIYKWMMRQMDFLSINRRSWSASVFSLNMLSKHIQHDNQVCVCDSTPFSIFQCCIKLQCMGGFFHLMRIRVAALFSLFHLNYLFPVVVCPIHIYILHGSWDDRRDWLWFSRHVDL